MNGGDRLAARRLWRRTAAVGLAIVVAALSIAVATLWDARELDSTIGEVVGTRDVDTESGPRPELLVAYQTAGGETMMFAEAVGSLAPEVGDRVTVWYSEGDAPRALIARQRFAWPVMLLPVGLVLAAFGLWLQRRARPAATAELDVKPGDVKLDVDINDLRDP